jgi:hypothetical protein
MEAGRQGLTKERDVCSSSSSSSDTQSAAAAATPHWMNLKTVTGTSLVQVWRCIRHAEEKRTRYCVRLAVRTRSHCSEPLERRVCSQNDKKEREDMPAAGSVL